LPSPTQLIQDLAVIMRYKDVTKTLLDAQSQLVVDSELVCEVDGEQPTVTAQGTILYNPLSASHSLSIKYHGLTVYSGQPGIANNSIVLLSVLHLVVAGCGADTVSVVMGSFSQQIICSVQASSYIMAPTANASIQVATTFYRTETRQIAVPAPFLSNITLSLIVLSSTLKIVDDFGPTLQPLTVTIDGVVRALVNSIVAFSQPVSSFGLKI